MDLPEAHGLGVIHGVVNPITLDLPIGLLRFLPAHHHGVLGYDPCLDVPRRAGRGLLPSPGLHWLTGRALANRVEGRDTDLILSVGVESADAVACGGDSIHGLILAIWGLCPVLDDVVSHWVWVARVPGDGDTGGSGLSHHRGTRRFG